MSKRSADSQRNGDTEDFEIIESQMEGSQRATAAQLASRNLKAAKGRLGRRFPSQQRPAGVFGNSAAQDSNIQSTMTSQVASNGTQIPQGAFGFGQQPNGLTQNFDQSAPTNTTPFSTSASFPPFGSGQNNEFKPLFPPKSSSFDFNMTKNTSFNNPFASANGSASNPSTSNAAQQSSGFQGSIFNIPPTAPFSSGSPTTAKPAGQNPFNWGSSAGSTESQTQPLNNVFKFSKPESSPSSSPNPFGNATPQPSTNLFGQNNALTASPSPAPAASDVFGQKLLPQAQAQSPQQTPDLFGPTSSQQSQGSSNIFGFSAINSKQPHQSSLFAPDEDSMSTSPDNSPQPKDSTSRPFSFLNPQAGSNNNSGDEVHTQGSGLFSKIPQPVFTAPAANTTEGSSPQPSPLLRSSPDPPSFSTKTQNTSTGLPSGSITTRGDVEQISPTRSYGDKTKESFSMFVSESTKSTTDNHSGHVTLPTQSPSLEIDIQAQSSNLAIPNNAQNSNISVLQQNSSGDTSLVTAQLGLGSDTQTSIFDHSAWGTPPPAPPDFDDDQRRQLIIGYHLKCLDAGLQHYISANPNFYAESDSDSELEPTILFYNQLKEAILNGECISQESHAGGKRKSVFYGYENEAHSKKARFNDEEANSGGLIATSSTAQPLLTEPASLPQAFNMKRKADEEIERSSSKDFYDGIKRSRGDPSPIPSALPSSSSQTANIFKNILDKKRTDNSQNILEHSSFNLQGGDSSSPPISITPSPSKWMNAPKSQDQSIFSSSATPSESLQQTTVSSSSNNKTSTISTNSSFNTVFPPRVQLENVTADQNHSGSSEAKNNLPSSSLDKPSFAPPKFDLASSDFLSQFGKAAEDTAKKEKQGRKAKDFDSDEEDEAEWERKDAEEQLVKKQKLDDALKGKTAQFIPGKGFTLSTSNTQEKEPGNVGIFGSSGVSVLSAHQGSSTSVLSRPPQGLANGHNIFGHLSDAESGPEGSKTGDADDEDTASEGGDEHDVKDTHIDVKNFNKIDETPKSFLNRKPAGSVSTPSDHIAEPSTEGADQVQSSGRSIFDRISKDTDGNLVREIPSPTENKSENIVKTPWSQPSNIFGQTTQEIGTNIFSSVTPVAPKGNIFGQPPPVPTPDTNTPVPPLTPKPGLFGQPPTDSPTPSVGSKSSPGVDNTWRRDSPIKFATSSNNPSGVPNNSSTPSKASLGELFGPPPAHTSAENTPKLPTTNIFSTINVNPPNEVSFGFNFGGPPKSTLGALAPLSNIASGATSRATSPGITTGGESANESNADEDGEKHEQLDLAAGGPGEEDEDVLFTAKAKALSYDASTTSWLSQGVGMIRVLKHRESTKTRILMRQDPSGKIVLNAALLGTLKYEYTKPKAVRMAVATDTGKLSTWMIRVGKDEDATELARVLEANKSN